jgi:hypothetical protein
MEQLPKMCAREAANIAHRYVGGGGQHLHGARRSLLMALATAGQLQSVCDLTVRERANT